MAIRTMLYIGNDEFISAEVLSGNKHSREQVMVAPTTFDIMPGTAMGIVTASGLYTPWNPAANDGSQNFAGWLCHRAVTNTVPARKPMLVRDADVNMNKVSYVVAATGAPITLTAAQLTALQTTMSGPNFRIIGRF